MIQFRRSIPEASRAAVERALTVTTSQPVTGSWAWLSDAYGGSRVHWRPKDYWPVGTTVKMAARLYGLDMGAAGFGKADLTTDFTIGRSQIVKADARLASGTDRLNWIMMGAPTPTVWPSPIVVVALTSRFGATVRNSPATGALPPGPVTVPVNR